MEVQLQGLTAVASFIVTASLKATLLVGLVLLVQKLFNRFLSANGRYLLWWTVVIGLVVPTGFDIRMPDFHSVFTHDGTELVTPAMRQPAATAEQLDAMPTQSTPLTDSDASDRFVAGTLPRDTLLSLLWLAGALVVLGTMVVTSSRYVRLPEQDSPASDELKALLRSCSELAGCRSDVRLVVSDKLQLPAVSGLLRPVLLWPAGLEAQLTRQQLRHVLMHELMHVKRKDIHSACLTSLVQALHWFNPVIWVAFSRLRQDRELACDAATLRQLGAAEARAYAQTLLHLGVSLPRTASPLSGLGILDTRRQLYQRVLMLVAARPSRRLQTMLTVGVFLPLALLAFGQPVPASQRQDLQIQNRQREVSTETIVTAEIPAASGIPDSPDTPPLPTPALAADEPVAPVDVAASTAPATPPLVAESAAVDAAPPADPSPEAALLAAVLELEAGTVPAEGSGVTASPALTSPVATSTQEPQRDADVAAAAELICVRIDWGNNQIRPVCDNARQWSSFEQRAGLEPGSIARAVAAADHDQVLVIERQICRTQQAPTMIVKKRECRSASEWAAIDLDRNVHQYGRATLGFQNFTVDEMARANNARAGIW